MRVSIGLIFVAILFTAPGWSQPRWADDQREVLEAINGYLAAWNAQDAEALASYCAEDCDRIDARGNVYFGRAAIRDHYAAVFSRAAEPDLPRTLSYEILSIRVLTPALAIVDANYTLTNPPPCPGGTIKGMNTVVLTKTDGRWLRRSHRQRIPDQLAMSESCQFAITSMRDDTGASDAVKTVLDVQDEMYAAMLSSPHHFGVLDYLSADFVATDPSNNVRRYEDLASIILAGRLAYDDIDVTVAFAEQLGESLVVVLGTETTQQSAVPVEGELERQALSNELVRQYTHVYRQEDGRWLLLVKQSTTISTRPVP